MISALVPAPHHHALRHQPDKLTERRSPGTLIDAWLHSRLQSSHRAPGFGEPLSKLDFELCDLMRYRCHPGQDVTRQQTHSELVRVMNNDRVVDWQVK